MREKARRRPRERNRGLTGKALRDRPPPLSLLDFPPQDDGVAGARLAINDNNTTGRFLKQEFALEVVESASASDLIAEVSKRFPTANRLESRTK